MQKKYYKKRILKLHQKQMTYFSVTGNKFIKDLYDLLDKDLFHDISYEIASTIGYKLKNSNIDELIDMYVFMKMYTDRFYYDLIINAFNKKIDDLKMIKECFVDKRRIDDN